MSEQMFNIKFVEEVKKHVVLYNCTLPGYSRKDLTEKAWCKVAKEMQMSESDCKEKWKNLRAVFVRNMKPAPSDSGLKRKKPYYLAEAMQFTLPFIKVLNKASSENLPNISQVEQDIFEDVKIEENSLQIAASLQQPPPLSTTPISELPSTSCASVLYTQNDTVNKSFNEYLAAKKPKIVAIQCKNCRQIHRTEAARHFLLSLLPELEEMTDQQIKIFKRRVFLIIDDITGQDLSTSAEFAFSPASDHSLDSQAASDCHI